ncbi:MAG: helix-turn-helix transcriptional regulator [Gemmatimonadota bacterium]
MTRGARGEIIPSREHTFSFETGGLFRRHVGQAEVLAAPGDAIFFPRQSEYRTSHPCDGGDRGIGVRVDSESLDEILDRAGLARRKRAAMVSTRALLPPRYVLRLRRLIASLEGDEDASLEVDETVLLLLGEATEQMAGSGKAAAERASTRRAHRRAVDRVIEIVQARLHEKLRLEWIAREVAYSPYHLCRMFKRETGMSLHQYINRQRLLTTLEKLGETENLSRLALQVGFASHSHLTMTFRKKFGIAPSRMR